MGVTIRIERLLRGLQRKHQCEEDCVRDETEAEDVFQKDQPMAGTSEHGTPRTSMLLADDCEEMLTSCSESARALFQDEIAKLVKQLGDSRVHIATLEVQIQLLKQEKEVQKAQHNQHIEQLEAQLLRLEQQAEVDVAELKQRQNLIEFEMPALEEQLKSLKHVMRDFNVTEPLYAELLAVPEDRRSLRDHILILAYEKMQSFRLQEENLRMERDTSRETCVRANDEVERLQRENQRLLASHSVQKKEMEKEVEAMTARCERLETDLKEVIVQVQVLSAKGSMYDEIREELEKSKKTAEESERNKMIAETSARLLSDEKQRILELIKEKDHTLELLKMDKAYLTREVKVQEDLVRKLDQEKQRQQEKIRELKRSKQEAYDRIVLGSQESNSVQEQRFQSELQRLQDQSRRELEKARREATETASRESQLLREMRDVALSELEKSQAALQDVKTAYDELLFKYNECQKVYSVKDSDVRNDVRMKQFELDRLHTVHDETKLSLMRSRVENEALTEKVRILTERYHELDVELGKRVQSREGALTSSDCRGPLKDQMTLETVAGQETESAQEGIWVQKLAAAVTVIVQRQLHRMESKCLELQNALEAAEMVNAELVTELKGKRPVEIGTVHDEVVNKEQKNHIESKKLQESLAEKLALETALRDTRREKDRVTHLLQKLKDDLRRLLEARGSIEDLEKLLCEKGSNVREEVMRRFNTLKCLESCAKCRLEN